MIGSLPLLPGLSAATEGFPPSVAVAAPRLRSRGVHLVVISQTRPGLPFADETFELVISRHPVVVWWQEIARVLRPGGAYFAQHVGPHSLRSLSEFLMGPLPDTSKRDTEVERRAAEAAGLVVQNMRLEHPDRAFCDIGAVVHFLRLVPGSSPASPCRRTARHCETSIRPSSVTERSRQPPAGPSSKPRSHREPAPRTQRRTAARTVTIITTTPNETLAPIHDRMPIILPPSVWDAWLDPTNDDTEAVAKRLVLAPAELLVARPVSTAVNSIRNDGSELIEPADAE
jgi:hypothetical protein